MAIVGGAVDAPVTGAEVAAAEAMPSAVAVTRQRSATSASVTVTTYVLAVWPSATASLRVHWYVNAGLCDQVPGAQVRVVPALALPSAPPIVGAAVFAGTGATSTPLELSVALSAFAVTVTEQATVAPRSAASTV